LDEPGKLPVIDKKGFRLNVGIILANQLGDVLWARRIGQDAWQFPQGGLILGETLEEAVYRELYEELGLEPQDVTLLSCTQRWLYYELPKQFLREEVTPLVIGQKQKWYLLLLRASEQKIFLNVSETPEFDSWRWVDYWYPASHVIYFKRYVYRRMLKELYPHIKKLRRKTC